MGKQQVLVEGHALLLRACADLDRQRQPRQLGVRGPGVAAEGQRHQPRALCHQRQAELARQPVAQVARADLRDRQPARGDDQATCRDGATIGINLIAASAFPICARGQKCHIFHAARLPVLHMPRGAFGQQHGNDVFGRAVAKQLALVFFVVADAVLVHQRDEVLRRKARERRARELRVLAHVVPVRRAHVQVAVGEVAAPAA